MLLRSAVVVNNDDDNEDVIIIVVVAVSRRRRLRIRSGTIKIALALAVVVVVVLIFAADKTSLEKQWDIFTSITDLEIKPIIGTDDENYQHFEVVDVFVRSGSTGTGTAGTTGWFRIGKVCATGTDYGGSTSIEAALTLQKGLILWTSVHMRRELIVGVGKGSALEVGYISPPIVYMGTDTDSSIDKEEEKYITIVDNSNKVPLDELCLVKPNTYGLRPDWNPAGFTYKRREKDAMKKKKNKNKKKTLEEILDE